ncbi:hypothetical protein [Piscirickettsia salmonis]|uniref:hypothetical protein n=1 Tax=Piscirickettsia salmonis TaxID=1238 RepID=UPI0007C958FB|nr:hypothetical protein A0O36_02489 [Piscirickettsiaceae bacterium NZ-RLO1]
MKGLDLKSDFLFTLAAMGQLLEDKTLQGKEIIEEQDKVSRKAKKEQDKIKKREQRAQASRKQKLKSRVVSIEDPAPAPTSFTVYLPRADGTDEERAKFTLPILRAPAALLACTEMGSASQGSASQGSASQGSTSQGSTSQGSTSQGSASQGSTSQGSTSEGSTPQDLTLEDSKDGDARLNLKEYAASINEYQAKFQQKSAASKQKLSDLLQKYQIRYNSNFVDYLGDLLKIKNDLVTPFLTKLNAFIESFIEDTRGSRSDAIQFLLDTQHLAEMFPSKRDVALFEGACELVFDIKSIELGELIQALYGRTPDSEPGEVDSFKLQALREISDQLGLNVIVPSGAAYLKSRQQVEESLASSKKKLQETECLRDGLSKHKSCAEIKQHEVLDKIIGLYVHGSVQDGLKPHARKYFDRLFGPYFKFNNGQPQLSAEYTGDGFDFQAILKGIVENCKEKRTVWAVMGRQLQAGKTAELLLEEASRYAEETGFRNIEGDVRRGIPFSGSWDICGPPYKQEVVIQTLNGSISGIEDEIAYSDRENRGLIFVVQNDINETGVNIKFLIEEMIERKRQEEERKKREEAERKRAELAERQKLVECKALLPAEVVKSLEGPVSGSKDAIVKLIVQCILDTQGQGNEALQALHYLLAKNYAFLKKPENNPVTDCSTTMSGQKEVCSGEWGVIEFTLAKCMFVNAEKSSTLASIPELILQNPFLKLYKRLQSVSDESAEADVVEGAGVDVVDGAEAGAVGGAEAGAVGGAEAGAVGGAEADVVDGAGVSAGIEDVERELKAEIAASKIICDIDVALGGDKESKKEDLELIRAQVQSVSDNRVLEKIFTWLMTQEYLWKTRGFSFTKTTMFGKEQFCRSTWGRVEECFAKQMTKNSCQAALYGERGAKGIDELIEGNPFLNRHGSLIKKEQKNFDLEAKEPEAGGRIFERQQSTEASNIESSLEVSYASTQSA